MGATLRNTTALSVFFMYPCCSAKWESSSPKKGSRPWWDRGCEPGLQYLCNHRGFVNSGNSPSLGTTKARCPNHPIARKLCLTKKNKPFSPTFAQCKIHRILTLREEQRAIFDPADSGLAFSSISLKVRGRGHVLGTKKGELTVFSIFCHKTLTIFCDIFPNAAQNMQQSTKKEGVSRP